MVKLSYSIRELSDILDDEVYSVACNLVASGIPTYFNGKPIDVSKYDCFRPLHSGATIFVYTGSRPPGPSPSTITVLSDTLPESWNQRIKAALHEKDTASAPLDTAIPQADTETDTPASGTAANTSASAQETDQSDDEAIAVLLDNVVLSKKHWEDPKRLEHFARSIGEKWMNETTPKPGVDAIAKYVEKALKEDNKTGPRGDYWDWQTIKKEALPGITGRKANGKK